MLQHDRELLRNILSGCASLAQADERLKRFWGKDADRQRRWGIWDGYRGRPDSTAGLAAPGSAKAEQIESQYKEGYNLGKELRAAKG